MFKHVKEIRDNPTVATLAAVGAAEGLYKYYVAPTFKEHIALLGWGVTLAVPGMYDAWAISTGHETMSHAFHRGMEHPIYRFMCVGALGALTLHLARGTGDFKTPAS